MVIFRYMLVFVLSVILPRIEGTKDINLISTKVLQTESASGYLYPAGRIRKSTSEPAFGGYFIENFPVCLEKPDPVYPDSALNAGIEGIVNLMLLLDSLGVIEEVTIMSSSGSELLDQAAIDAAWRSKWLPAETNGAGVSVWTAVHYGFEIPE